MTSNMNTTVKDIQKEVEVKEVIKYVEKPIIITGLNQVMSYTNLSFAYKNNNLSFAISNSITGCGLGTFGAFTSISKSLFNDTEFVKFFKEVLFQKARSIGTYCLIATLGDSYVDTWENIIIEKLGFVKLLDYRNKNHTGSYRQSVYSLTDFL